VKTVSTPMHYVLGVDNNNGILSSVLFLMYLGLINTSALISAEAQNLLHQLDSITEAHLRTV